MPVLWPEFLQQRGHFGSLLGLRVRVGLQATSHVPNVHVAANIPQLGKTKRVPSCPEMEAKLVVLCVR